MLLVVALRPNKLETLSNLAFHMFCEPLLRAQAHRELWDGCQRGPGLSRPFVCPLWEVGGVRSSHTSPVHPHGVPLEGRAGLQINAGSCTLCEMGPRSHTAVLRSLENVHREMKGRD